MCQKCSAEKKGASLDITAFINQSVTPFTLQPCNLSFKKQTAFRPQKLRNRKVVRSQVEKNLSRALDWMPQIPMKIPPCDVRFVIRNRVVLAKAGTQ